MSKLFATKQASGRQNKPLLLTLLGLTQLLVVASVGCRSTSDNQIDLLERELRTQEDYIYELESYVVEYSEKLRDTRCAYPQQTAIYAEEMQQPEPAPKLPQKSSTRRSDSIRRSDNKELQLETNDDDLPSPAERQQSPQSTPEAVMPDSEVSPEEMDVPDEIEFEIDAPLSDKHPTHSLRQVAAVDMELETSDDGWLHIPDPLDFRSDPLASHPLESQPLAAGFDASRTEALAIENEQLTEQLFDDEQVEETGAFVEREIDQLQVTQLFQSEGEEQPSLLTVVEALDANGEPVDLDGEISLMVMTTGDDAPRRLKRWNFTSQETVAAWQSSDLGDGLHLELPLEALRLPTTPLELWVRLVTVDGRKLLTQLKFDSEQLPSVATAPTEQPSAGLSLATVESPTEVASALAAPARSPSSIETQSIPRRQPPPREVPPREVRPREVPPHEVIASASLANQPRWRASMQRTDQTSTGFAATSHVAQGWTTQLPGRQPSPSAQVASRTLPIRSRHVAPQPLSQRPSPPVWTSGRAELPATVPTSPPASGTTPASLSTSR